LSFEGRAAPDRDLLVGIDQHYKADASAGNKAAATV
jgi:hypothetical protein